MNDNSKLLMTQDYEFSQNLCCLIFRIFTPMQPVSISRKEARRLALHCQGLGITHPYGRGKSAVVRLLQQLGYVQIDTISVVQRAHHHVIWSRVPGYRREMLRPLQEKHRTIFEYWSHAAAYLPISDYRFALPTMQYYREEKDGWPKVDAAIKQHVLDRIRAEGPLMSKDFERPEGSKGDGWWDWKPAKRALQRLYFDGTVMVRYRQGFQRVYDLAERVLPAETDTRMPTTEEYAEFLIRRTLKAHGIATAPQMAYLRKGMGRPVSDRLAELAEEGVVTPVTIGRRNPLNYFALADTLDNVNTRLQNRMRILSPFDNAVIQRKRLSDLWSYDYQIECYVPAPKRVYGYFCLPLLYGEQFVGRIDAKADRNKGVLHLQHVVKESDMDDEAFIARLRPALEEFRAFNNCTSLAVHRTTPATLKEHPLL